MCRKSWLAATALALILAPAPAWAFSLGGRSAAPAASNSVISLVVLAGYIFSRAFFSSSTSPVSASIRSAAPAYR